MKTSFHILFALTIITLLLGNALPSHAQPTRGMKNVNKLALIIANNQYQYGGTLDAPVPTAIQLKQVLENNGVDVITGYNLHFLAFGDKIDEYARELSNYEVGFIFYLGHGFQIDGENYLIPIDANPATKASFKRRSINLDDILESTSHFTKPRAIFLDACRHNPYKDKWSSDNRSIHRKGLADLDAPRNTEIYFTVQKDREVSDDNRYMNFLMEEIKGGGCLDDMVRDVCKRVDAYDMNQVPATYGQMLDEVCFETDEEEQVDPRDLVPEGMVYVGGGTFMMGCDEKRDGDCKEDQKPLHKVTVSSFYMSKYEVTNEELCAFLNAKGNKKEEWIKWVSLFLSNIDIENARFVPKQGYERHPVVNATWYGATAYAAWKGGRLPTEAEWEFAARGGNLSRGYKYAGSNDLDRVAWYKDNSGSDTHTVGEKAPNELGIFDMSGNSKEWCIDRYARSYYANSPSRNPQGGATGYKYHVYRGGSYLSHGDNCRTIDRNSDYARMNPEHCGFRIVFPQI